LYVVTSTHVTPRKQGGSNIFHQPQVLTTIVSKSSTEDAGMTQRVDT